MAAPTNFIASALEVPSERSVFAFMIGVVFAFLMLVRERLPIPKLVGGQKACIVREVAHNKKKTLLIRDRDPMVYSSDCSEKSSTDYCTAVPTMHRCCQALKPAVLALSERSPEMRRDRCKLVSAFCGTPSSLDSRACSSVWSDHPLVAASMATLDIRGTPVAFPFKPYDCQLKYIGGVLEALDDSVSPLRWRNRNAVDLK